MQLIDSLLHTREASGSVPSILYSRLLLVTQQGSPEAGGAGIALQIVASAREEGVGRGGKAHGGPAAQQLQRQQETQPPAPVLPLGASTWIPSALTYILPQNSSQEAHSHLCAGCLYSRGINGAWPAPSLPATLLWHLPECPGHFLCTPRTVHGHVCDHLVSSCPP